MIRFGYSMIMISTLIITLFITGGCDVTDPTFIIDTAVTATIEIDEETSFYQGSEEVNLQELLDGIDGPVIDINVFNITLQIERLGNTPEDLSLNGSLSINGNTLMSLGDVPISVFANERSIFDDALVNQYNFSVDNDGLQYLLALFDDLPTVNVSVAGEASGNPVNVRVLTKLHAQVSTE